MTRLHLTEPPIDPVAVARQLGLPVSYERLGSEISGLLIVNARAARICVNHRDRGKRRGRFTIAHEIGHFVLGHAWTTGEHVHVDHGHFISQRGPLAATGIDPSEVDANQFAAALLMPGKMIRDAVGGVARGGVLYDSAVTALAKLFGVSEQAMTIRLTTLRLL